MPYRDPDTGEWFSDRGTPLEYVSSVDDADDDDYEPEPEPKPKRSRNFRRDLEDRSRKAREREQEADRRASDAERELAFYKAGVSPEDPRAKYFVRGYDGDLTADAIQAAAAEIGLATGTQQQQGPSQEQQAFERMANAVSGQAAPGARDLDAEMAALRNLPADEGRARLHALFREKGGAIVQD